MAVVTMYYRPHARQDRCRKAVLVIYFIIHLVWTPTAFIRGHAYFLHS